MVATEVSEGADDQIRVLTDAMSGLAGMASSLKESAVQAEAVASSTEELVSGISEMAASIVITPISLPSPVVTGIAARLSRTGH